MLLLGYTPKPEISLVSPYGNPDQYLKYQEHLFKMMCAIFGALPGHVVEKPNETKN